MFHALFILCVACESSSSTQSVSDYEKLCKIYEEVVKTRSSKTERIVLLTERIKKEIPDIYPIYQNAALVAGKEKYQFFKEAAETDTNVSWDCDAMKFYFSNDSSSH